MAAIMAVVNSWKKDLGKGQKTSADIMNSIYQSRTKKINRTGHLTFEKYLILL